MGNQTINNYNNLINKYYAGDGMEQTGGPLAVRRNIPGLLLKLMGNFKKILTRLTGGKSKVSKEKISFVKYDEVEFPFEMNFSVDEEGGFIGTGTFRSGGAIGGFLGYTDGVNYEKLGGFKW